MSCNPTEKPRLLGVRLGANPNSSSLSIDVTTLLLGGTGALLLGFLLSALLRGRRAKRVGDPPPGERKP